MWYECNTAIKIKGFLKLVFLANNRSRYSICKLTESTQSMLVLENFGQFKVDEEGDENFGQFEEGRRCRSCISSIACCLARQFSCCNWKHAPSNLPRIVAFLGNTLTLLAFSNLDGEGKVAKLVHWLGVVLAVQLLLQCIPGEVITWYSMIYKRHTMTMQ